MPLRAPSSTEPQVHPEKTTPGPRFRLIAGNLWPAGKPEPRNRAEPMYRSFAALRDDPTRNRSSIIRALIKRSKEQTYNGPPLDTHARDRTRRLRFSFGPFEVMKAISANTRQRGRERPSEMTSTPRIPRYVRMLLMVVLLHLSCAAQETSPDPTGTSPNTIERRLPLASNASASVPPNAELPQPIVRFPADQSAHPDETEVSPRRHKTRRKGNGHRSKPKKRKTVMQTALQSAARKGLAAMIDLYDRQEPEILKRGAILEANDPGSLLAQFSASNQTEMDAKAAYASLVAAKKFKERKGVSTCVRDLCAKPMLPIRCILIGNHRSSRIREACNEGLLPTTRFTGSYGL
uniref:Uncharacterized protein n=1 Tax=Anopheles atroparvus TaxID=41427 RepID=A0A182JJN5_ANOAO